MFQDDGLLPWRSARANVELPMAINGVPKALRRALAEKWLAKVGLAGAQRSLPRALSGGMRQRVQLARALAGSPGLLLMDEPFGALDGPSRTAMQRLLLDVRSDEPVTIVFVTHDSAEALALADRVVVLGGTPTHIVADLPSPVHKRHNCASARCSPTHLRRPPRDRHSRSHRRRQRWRPTSW